MNGVIINRAYPTNCPGNTAEDSRSELTALLNGLEGVKNYIKGQIKHCIECRDANVADNELCEASILNESANIYKEILAKLEAI